MKPPSQLDTLTADERLGVPPGALSRLGEVMRQFPACQSQVLCSDDNGACTALANALAAYGATACRRNGHRTEHEHVFDAAGEEYPSSIADRINKGKHILHLGHRSGKFVSVFEPPKGVVCHPFHKLVLGTQCPYDCAYCYLQITYRIAPYVRQYLNLEDLRRELVRLNDRLKKPALLNAGELSDPLALDPWTRVAEEIISWLPELPRIHILLLTKSGNTRHLPKLTGELEGRVIVSVSLTTEPNRKALEHGTASIRQRIRALEVAQTKGYGVRARFDPIVTARDDWEAEYDPVARSLTSAVDCDVITLGQPRFFPQLLNIAEKRFPGARELLGGDFSARTPDRRLRAEVESRIATYRKIMDMIRAHARGKSPHLMVCKEEPEVLRALAIKNPRLCNCTLG